MPIKNYPEGLFFWHRIYFIIYLKWPFALLPLPSQQSNKLLINTSITDFIMLVWIEKMRNLLLSCKQTFPQHLCNCCINVAKFCLLFLYDVLLCINYKSVFKYLNLNIFIKWKQNDYVIFLMGNKKNLIWIYTYISEA